MHVLALRPEKLPEVPRLLRKYRGAEQKLLTAVRAKYTPHSEGAEGEDGPGDGPEAHAPFNFKQVWPPQG